MERCWLCTCVFANKTALHKHLGSKVHSRLKVVCPFCLGEDRAFTKVWDLKIHAQSCHSDIEVPAQFYSQPNGIYMGRYPQDYYKIVKPSPWDSEEAVEARKRMLRWISQHPKRETQGVYWKAGWMELHEEMNSKKSTPSPAFDGPVDIGPDPDIQLMPSPSRVVVIPKRKGVSEETKASKRERRETEGGDADRGEKGGTRESKGVTEQARRERLAKGRESEKGRYVRGGSKDSDDSRGEKGTVRVSESRVSGDSAKRKESEKGRYVREESGDGDHGRGEKGTGRSSESRARGDSTKGRESEKGKYVQGGSRDGDDSRVEKSTERGGVKGAKGDLEKETLPGKRKVVEEGEGSDGDEGEESQESGSKTTMKGDVEKGVVAEKRRKVEERTGDGDDDEGKGESETVSGETLEKDGFSENEKDVDLEEDLSEGRRWQLEESRVLDRSMSSDKRVVGQFKASGSLARARRSVSVDSKSSAGENEEEDRADEEGHEGASGPESDEEESDEESEREKKREELRERQEKVQREIRELEKECERKEAAKRKSDLTERAKRILATGAMPACPPGRRNWDQADALDIQLPTETLRWPPKDFRGMTADERLLSLEYIAMSLERPHKGGIPRIPRQLLIDTYNFLVLPGTRKAYDQQDQPCRKVRYHNYQLVREVARGNIDSEEARAQIECLESIQAAQKQTTAVRLASRLLPSQVGLRLDQD